MKAAVIGGDERMLYAAKAFERSGAEVKRFGFEKAVPNCADRPEDVMSWADFALLPIRPIADGFLNCPLSEVRLTAADFCRLIGQKPIFCGGSEMLRNFASCRVRDYAKREDFAVQNAVLTAEGALELALRSRKSAICGSRILITGFGRIAKALANILSSMGARVSVAARRSVDRAWIAFYGMQPCDFSGCLPETIDLIFNTVPAPVLTPSILDRLSDDGMIIDLASFPGGLDKAACDLTNITYIHALNLPGKTAPKTAGEMIQKTVFQMIKEENGGKENIGLCDDRLLLHL